MLWDIRLALRRLAKSWVFTVFCVASFALGIGVGAAVYASVRELFLLPLGVPASDEVYPVLSGRTLVIPGVSWPDFADIRREVPSFSTNAASRPITATVTIGDESSISFGEAVSGDYFSTLRLSPVIGRLISPGDDVSATRVTVLSEAFWRAKLKSDPRVLGDVVNVGGSAFTVIGVVKGPFRGLGSYRSTTVWVPFTAAAHIGTFGFNAEHLVLRSGRTVAVWGRISDRTATGANRELSVLSERLDAATDGFERRWAVRRSLMEIDRADKPWAVVGLLLACAAALVLLASINVANLALARGVWRREEFFTCVALGADRWRLVRSQLVEACILVLAGGVAGLFALFALLRLINTRLPIERNVDVEFAPQADPVVITTAIASLGLVLVIFGLWPALQTSFESSIKRHIDHPPRWRFQRTIVAWQVTVSVFMSVAAGLSIESTKARAFGSNNQETYEHVALARLDLAASGNRSNPLELAAQVATHMREVPTVTAMAAATGIPAAGMMADGTARAVETGRLVQASILAGNSGAREVFDLRVVAGRFLSEADLKGRLPVAVISEPLAMRLFDSADVLSREIQLSRTGSSAATTYTVVGVTFGEAGVPLAWVPLGSDPVQSLFVAAKAPNPESVLEHLRLAIRQVDRELGVGFIDTAPNVLARDFKLLLGMANGAAIIGLLILLLALGGLYGLLSTAVALRTREIGVRLALGAVSRNIFFLILLDGIQPVLKGVVLGVTVSLLVSPLAQAASGISLPPLSLPLAMAVAALYILAGCVGCFVPAVRAARMTPYTALRHL